MANARRRVARRKSELDVPQQINLYNPAFKTQRSLLSLRGACAGWLAVAAMLFAFAGYQKISLYWVQQEERDLGQKLASAQAEAQRLGKEVGSRRHDARIEEEVSRLEQEVKGRHEVMDVLHAGGLGDTRGFSDYLKAFARQSFDGVWLTGLSIATSGKDVAVEGRALHAAYVPGYLKRLNGESAMQGHPFSDLLIQEPPPDPAAKAAVRPNYVEFKLTTRADGSTTKAGSQ
jgi:cell division protein FtsL